ncbi:lysophospholipid acyltransferase family protein [Heliophilum fasciatum]|uniref:Acyltransferase-like protein n=1 Tax=Heliophilum fasciatum TaxID=35700 RepID=A0A4R2RYQ0_9FIRM|nr:lysophospholipid acyltransferase family protein [Heliophilum fasciatum]MCW2276851.1 1-acyl-sn-glycerol-3-phosphate acyltransferase [Heliophilum fasciatum]TCP68688.1 acyltransferase-like protein [Heliophilum fasciatum]
MKATGTIHTPESSAMIATAPKSAWFQRLFFLYNQYYLLRRNFHTLLIRGDIDPFVPALAPARSEAGAGVGAGTAPILYMANHSSWWDGLLIYHALTVRSKGDHYMMMSQQELNKYGFFRKIGAFPMDASTRSGIMASLDYAVRLLQANRQVWIFPQGEILHQDRRPFRFMTGIGHLLRQCPQTRVVPVTLNYTFTRLQKPVVSMIFGQAYHEDWSASDRKTITERCRCLLEKQADEHRALVIDHPEPPIAGFTSILAPTKATDEQFTLVREKVTRWF